MSPRRRKGSDRYELIRELALKLPIEFLKCRAYGYDWGDQVKRAVDKSTWRVFADCRSCGAENWRDWSIYGEREESGTLYPKGYVLEDTGILETADRNILRALYLDRLPVG